MDARRVVLAVVAICAILTLLSCKASNKSSTNSASAEANAAAEAGPEKAKPAPGTGNVQGKVFYNNKPVPNIEVKLCETFSRFVSGCGGKVYTARTDTDGVYLIANIPPKAYEALTARVFDTDEYVFATSGFAGISAAKYEVASDKTLFVSTTHLFKSDLKLTNPKAAAKVSTQGLELKWEPYPEAAYYKVSVFPNDHLVTSPFTNKRVDGTSFSVDKPLQSGTYRWQVTAFSGQDRKLAESPDDIEFTITDGGK
jgi:hypothetical protein